MYTYIFVYMGGAPYSLMLSVVIFCLIRCGGEATTNMTKTGEGEKRGGRKCGQRGGRIEGSDWPCRPSDVRGAPHLPPAIPTNICFPRYFRKSNFGKYKQAFLTHRSITANKGCMFWQIRVLCFGTCVLLFLSRGRKWVAAKTIK